MESAYDRWELRRAVNLAAVLGWAGVSLAMVGPTALLFWAAIFGMPIAFAASWLVGAPILKRAMRQPIGWWAAAIWGGGIATLIGLLSIVIGRTLGWLQSRDTSFGSQLGAGDRIQSVDGILTPYGWWLVAQDTALFILMGVAIGLIVRWRIGPGRAD